nr:hypothetical protein B0A51_01586 [Rachicladosporium sp. CCFEE 5018]
MSAFLLASPSQSASSTPAYTDSPAYGSDDDDDQDTLPYPTELPRRDFLAPDFDPQTYLSSLRNRHQTLEDLRSDLRQRSQLLNRELMDLVNGNYEEFLSLGGDLRDGGEKVEGVRVGLLAFQREVEGIRRAVKERASETKTALDSRKGVRKEVVLGRKLLDLADRVEELEGRLGTADGEALDDESDELDIDDGVDDSNQTCSSNGVLSRSIRRLDRQCVSYMLITRQAEAISSSHPFVATLQPRIDGLRKTIILDLSAALRTAISARVRASILFLTQLFANLGGEKDAVRLLRHG